MPAMRKCRTNLPNRCYHLISRVAHRAFFLDADERTRLAELIRRAAAFSGVKLLAYSVMSNHFHVFVYIGRPEALSDAEIVRRISALCTDVRFVWHSSLTLLPPRSPRGVSVSRLPRGLSKDDWRVDYWPPFALNMVKYSP